MTDYRDLSHPGMNPSRPKDYRPSHSSGTSIGGILIALALIGLLFLAVTLLFGGSGDETLAPQAVAPATTSEQTGTTSPTPVPVPVTPATE